MKNRKVNKARRRSRADRRRRQQSVPFERRRGYYRQVEIYKAVMNDAVILTVVNEVVSDNCAPLIEGIKNFIKATDKKIILDLRGVPYIDSTAIGLLVELKKIAAEKGKQLYLSGVRAQPRYLIEVLLLDNFFKFLE